MQPSRVGGNIVRTATGRAAEALRAEAWSVKEWRGQQAVIEIVDEATGDWGHINADHFTLADAPVRATDSAAWLDYGPDFYAGVTWSGAPNGRRVMEYRYSIARAGSGFSLRHGDRGGGQLPHLPFAIHAANRSWLAAAGQPSLYVQYSPADIATDLNKARKLTSASHSPNRSSRHLQQCGELNHCHQR